MKSVDISDETFEKIKNQLQEEDVQEVNTYDDLIGGKYYFRTVTYHMVGRVTKRVGSFLCLQQSSWVADSGRFTQAIKEGSLNEVEPVGISYVNIDSVTDFFPWNHSLPTKQKWGNLWNYKVGVKVGVRVEVGVGVEMGVRVGVRVGVGVGVEMGVRVGVRVGVGLGVGVGVGLGVGVGVGVGVINFG